MIYKIKIAGSFAKDFAKLDSLTQDRILLALEKMRHHPFYNAKKLTNADIGQYRVRVGDYRIRFDVIKDCIYLYRVRHRREVYRN